MLANKVPLAFGLATISSLLANLFLTVPTAVLAAPAPNGDGAPLNAEWLAARADAHPDHAHDIKAKKHGAWWIGSGVGGPDFDAYGNPIGPFADVNGDEYPDVYGNGGGYPYGPGYPYGGYRPNGYRPPYGGYPYPYGTGYGYPGGYPHGGIGIAGGLGFPNIPGLPGQYGNGIPPWRNGYKAKNGGNIPKPESTGPHTRGEQEEEQVTVEREEMWVGSQQ